MPDFKCQLCGEAFSLPKATLDKYPGWEPKYCREHSPNKKKSKASGKKKASRSRRTTGCSKEENLTRAEVLAKYTDGPDTNLVTSSCPRPQNEHLIA